MVNRLLSAAALCLVALAPGALSTSTSSASETTDVTFTTDTKIQVELYYEAQCPGCRQVLTTSFKEAFAAPGFLKMADVTLVPFGNAKETPSISSGADGTTDEYEYEYECQHGPSECHYNAVEACGLSKIKCPYAAFAFINCIENYDESRDPDQNYDLVVASCAALTGVADRTAADIQECSTGPEGNGLIHQNAQKTAALNPPHTYVPWIVADGKHTDDIENDVSDSLLQYVCDQYQGEDKSPACAGQAEEKRGIRGATTTSSSSSQAGLPSVDTVRFTTCSKDTIPLARQE